MSGAIGEKLITRDAFTNGLNPTLYKFALALACSQGAEMDRVTRGNGACQWY
jgi:hypothetical protein